MTGFLLITFKNNNIYKNASFRLAYSQGDNKLTHAFFGNIFPFNVTPITTVDIASNINWS